MTRAECIAIAFALGFALFVLTCVQSPRLAGAQGVTFDASHWGSSGAGSDLTGRVHRPYALDQYLPLTPTDGVDGWVEVSTACSLAALQSAASAGVDKRIYQFPPACEIVTTQTGGFVWSVSNASDRVIFRGASEADRVRVLVDLDTVEPTPPNNFQVQLFSVGSTNPTPIATWTWAAGYAKGSQVLTVTGLDEVYEGDIIRLRVDSWTDRSEDWQKSYRVLCARWGDVNHGTDCTGVSANGHVRIDQELFIDFSTSGAGDPDYGNGSFTGHQVDHMERVGGGTITDNIPEFVGFEYFEIEHNNWLGQNSSQQGMHFQGSFESWATHFSMGPWGNSWGDFGGGGSSNSNRTLIAHSDFEGPLFSGQCSIVVTALSAQNPVVITGAGQECDTDLGSFRPYVGFPSDFYEPNLAGNYYRVDCNVAGADCTAQSFVFGLEDYVTGAAIDGTGFNSSVDTAHDVILQYSQWSIGGFYIAAETSDAQLVNNSFKNYRVGPLMQANVSDPHLVANYFVTDGTMDVSRCIFNHGNTEIAGLFERNDCDGGIASYATSAQGDGQGPYLTYLYNRGRGRDVAAGAGLNDQCPDGGLCVEQGSGQSFHSDQNNMIGNFWELLEGHQGGIDGQATGTVARFTELEFSRNVIFGETLTDDFAAGNATTSKPDYLEGDAVDSAADAGWGSTVWPTSLFYDRQIESDASFAPSWWCQEACPFVDGFAAPADDYNAGSPSYCKLPAQIRLEGGTCTPLAAGASPAFRIHGGSFSGGTLN